jgi:hypothetical protein
MSCSPLLGVQLDATCPGPHMISFKYDLRLKAASSQKDSKVVLLHVLLLTTLEIILLLLLPRY